MKTEVSKEKIINIVCNYFEKTITQFKERNRQKEIAYQRQILCYFLNEFTNLSFCKIGEEIKRDHANVIYSVNKIKIEKEIYSEVRKDIENISVKILVPSCIVSNVDLLQIAKHNTLAKLFLT